MNAKKLLIVLLSALLAAALLVLGFSGCAPKPGERVFKFAVLYPFSGPAVSWGFPALYTAQLARDDINAAGGIKVKGDSYQIAIAEYDNKWDPAETATVARKAIFDDKINYISTFSTAEIAAINDLLQREKVLAIVTTGARNWLGPKYPYTWKALYDDQANIPVFLEYITKAHPNYRSVAAIWPDTPLGHEQDRVYPGQYRQAGLDFRGAKFIATGQEDFYPVFTAILAGGAPDMIDVAGMSPAAKGNVIKQGREVGYKGVFVAPATFDIAVVAGIAGWEAVEGSIFVDAIEYQTAAGKDLQARLRAKGAELNWTVYLYNAFWLLKLGIEKANTFDAEKVIAAMDTVEYEGVLGKAFYGGKAALGLNRAMITMVPVAEVKGGKPVDVHQGLAVFE